MSRRGEERRGEEGRAEERKGEERRGYEMRGGMREEEGGSGRRLTKRRQRGVYPIHKQIVLIKNK